MQFGRYNDSSVDFAVDLINTRDRNGDELRTPEHLRAFLREHGWDLGGGEITERTVAEVRAGRDELRSVFDRPASPAAAATLNRLVVEAAATPQLTDHDGQGWHLHFDSPGAALAQRVVGSCAAALMLLSHDPDGQRLGICDAEDCRWVYVDTSKNRSRRHCGDTCTTRERVRAHRRRRAAADRG